MTTTFEKFSTAKRKIYSTLPTIDVTILPDVRHCRTCGSEAVWDSSRGVLGNFAHADGNDDHRADVKSHCVYCNNEDGVRYVQYLWHDAVECPRCGGVDGYAIGD